MITLNLRIRNTRFVVLCLLTTFYFADLAQNTYTFTNCGATGSVGPTQLQVNNSYSLTNLSGIVGTTISGIQTWTAPYTGNFRIEARGAQGGISNSIPGGLGATMAGDFALVAGEVIQILVGQVGDDGGAGPGGGGGGSFVIRAPYTNTSSILVIAGGGSGAGNYSFTNGVSTSAGVFGGVSGGANGTGGLGGTRGAGGGGFLTNGDPCSVNVIYASPGQAYINGGRGGPVTNNVTCNFTANGGFGGGSSHGGNCINNGGAGGGYSGGGGSSNTTSGGGGSLNQGINQTNSSGSNTGNGKVIITELCSVKIFASGSNSLHPTLCAGNSLTLTTDAVSNYSWSTGSTSNPIVVSPIATTVYSVSGTSAQSCIAVGFITVTVNSSVPVLSLSVSSPSVCLGNTVSITASGALTYTISGGVTNGLAFTPSVSSNYTVQGQNGCGTTSTVTSIAIAALPVVAIVSPTLVCAGNTATLSGGGATTYTWYPGGFAGVNVGVSPQVNTTYTVVGGSGNCLGTNTVALATNPNPTLTTSSTHFTMCAGESVTITATGALGYTWTPGNLNGSSIVVTPTVPSAYSVIGDNSFGCTSSTQQPVIAYPSPNMVIAASTTLVCSGGMVTLNANGATTYSWSNGATTPITTVTPLSNTIYSVVGTDPNNVCTTTKTIEISVFTASISVSNPVAICIGESTTLTASGANSYNWSNGGIGSDVVVSPVTSTNYTVTGISTVGGTTCSSTGTTAVTVNALPTLTASSTRTAICRGETTDINAAGANTYTWNTAATGPMISVSPSVQTQYTVSGTDGNGCENNTTILIRVFACTGLNEVSANKEAIQVYPNPSNGEFSIQAEESMSLKLMNQLGQEVKTLELTKENNFKVDVKDLAKGVYFITSQNENQSIN